jgi:hypothetical protein
MNGEDLKRLVADFNRDWPDITRTRELLVKRWRGRRNRLLALASSAWNIFLKRMAKY